MRKTVRGDQVLVLMSGIGPTKSKRQLKVKVHAEKDCSAEMVKCAEETPVELVQADLCNLKPCSLEELAEMGNFFETTSVAADLFNPTTHSPYESITESVAHILAASSSNQPPQENDTTGDPVTKTNFITLDQGLFDEETESDEEGKEEFSKLFVEDADA
jgi:hypothetical protein